MGTPALDVNALLNNEETAALLDSHQMVDVDSARPEMASFGPWRRSRLFSILKIDRYSSG
jgi:hypothetical protein